jgi:hypothetical protein
MSEKHKDNRAELPERERIIKEILRAGTDILDRKLGIYDDNTQLINDPYLYRSSTIIEPGSVLSMNIAGPYPNDTPTIALAAQYNQINLHILTDSTVGKFVRKRTTGPLGHREGDTVIEPISDEELNEIHERIIWYQLTAEPVLDDDW